MPNDGSPTADRPDAGSPDAGSPDAGSPDAGSDDIPDAGPTVASAHRIVALDSGVGGLTVVREIRKTMPDVRVTYIADNAAFPYGGRDAAVLIDRVRHLAVTALKDYGGDAVVVACNTASTVVLDALRACLTVPVLGVVPPIKPAAALSRSRAIGLLATEGTARRAYVDALIAAFAADCTVIRVSAPDLARLAEDRMRGIAVGPERIRDALAPLFGPDAPPVDAVALGCTHYPLLLDLFQEVAPPGVHWIDPAPAVARRLRDVFSTQPLPVAAHRADRDILLFTADPGRTTSLTGFLTACGFPDYTVRPMALATEGA